MERSSRYKESKVQTESMYTVLCCCCLVTECRSTLWDPMDCSTQAPLSFTDPRVCSNAWPGSCWCSLNSSSSANPFSFCIHSFPASGSFPVSQLFASGGQSIGASASVLPMNIQGWFPLGLTSVISLQSKGLSGAFSSTTLRSVSSSAFFTVQPWHQYMILEKPHLRLHTGLRQQSAVSAFNMLSRCATVFLPKGRIRYHLA